MPSLTIRAWGRKGVRVTIPRLYGCSLAHGEHSSQCLAIEGVDQCLWILHPITAFLLDWLVVALMAVVALSVNLSLPSRYYEFKPFEDYGRVYELLGVPFFKKLVRRGPLSIFSRSFRLPKRDSSADLWQLDQKMRGAETIHLFSFLAIWPFIFYAMVRKWPAAAAWLLLFNLIVNAYPIMPQRYNRIKLHELLASNETQGSRA